MLLEKTSGKELIIPYHSDFIYVSGNGTSIA
jgi:hypothetical protein